jgi:hypothetical protein
MNNDLSDNQRRFICRTIFLLVCSLPTIAVVYFAAHQRTADQWAQLVQAELGVETSIGGVESPRPGEYVFQDVKLYDDQGTLIFDSLKADVSIGDKNRIDFRDRIRISRASMSHFLMEAAGRLVKPQVDLKPWSVRFHDLEIFDESAPEFSNRPFHSNEVVVKSGSGINGPKVTLEANEWGKFELLRNLTEGRYHGELRISINTNRDGGIPCWLAKDWFPALNQLGSSAYFSGEVGIHSLGGVSICGVTGNFINLDLPEKAVRGLVLPGTADMIQVNSLEFEGSRWNKGKAWIVAGNQQREIPNYDFELPIREPDQLFHHAIRSAFRDVWDGKALNR